MLPVLLAVFAALVAFYVWWYYDYIKKQGGISEIPGPTIVPLLGNALSFSNSIPGKFVYYILNKIIINIIKAVTPHSV